MAKYLAATDLSRFSVQAFAGGLLSSFAHNPTFAVRTFSATLEFDPASPAGASIQLAADAGSLRQTDNVRPADREEIERVMRSEVLEVEKYPQIIYRSTEIASDRVTEGWFRCRIRGELSLHGVAKAHALEATVRINDDTLRFSGETSIRMPDFRLKQVSALAGTIKLKEEINLAFDFAMKSAPSP